MNSRHLAIAAAVACLASTLPRVAAASGSGYHIEAFGFQVQYTTEQYVLCMDGTTGTSGTQLKSNTCAYPNSNSQLWTLQQGRVGQNLLILSGTGGTQCARATSFAKGAAVELANCNSDDHNQWWLFINGGIYAAYTVLYDSNPHDTFCLNVQSGSNAPGTVIDLNYCAAGNATTGGNAFTPDGAEVWWPGGMDVQVTSYLGDPPYSTWPGSATECMEDDGGTLETTSCTAGASNNSLITWLMTDAGLLQNVGTGRYVTLSESGVLSLSSTEPGWYSQFSIYSPGSNSGSCSDLAGPTWCTWGMVLSGFAPGGGGGCMQGDYNTSGISYYYSNACYPWEVNNNPNQMLGMVTYNQ